MYAVAILAQASQDSVDSQFGLLRRKLRQADRWWSEHWAERLIVLCNLMIG